MIKISCDFIIYLMYTFTSQIFLYFFFLKQIIFTILLSLSFIYQSILTFIYYKHILQYRDQQIILKLLCEQMLTPFTNIHINFQQIFMQQFFIYSLLSKLSKVMNIPIQQLLKQMQDKEPVIVKLISPARPLLLRVRSPLHSIYQKQFNELPKFQYTYEDQEKLNNQLNSTKNQKSISTYVIYQRNVKQIWNFQLINPSKTISKHKHLFIQSGVLQFDSNFQSGNLQSASKVHFQQQYNLLMQNDVNTYGYTQWFFYKVKNGIPNKVYKFNIENFYKNASLYQKGMKIMVYSKIQNQRFKRGWYRAGQNISYFYNGNFQITARGKKKKFYTLSFTYIFKYLQDEVMFASNYPYTYTELNSYIDRLQQDCAHILKRSLVTRTLAGNKLQILTITNKNEANSNINKKGIIITSRVHPGQTVSSYVVKGIIDYLTSDDENAFYLRQNFIFKIVPMINPDGVIHGNYRTSLSGNDLNRKWQNPNKNLHPEIYYLKKTILQFSKSTNTIMFCDMHGHSKKKNVFIYGCFDKNNPFSTKQFPFLISKLSKYFSYHDCSFGIKQDKKGTARVVLWKSLGIPNIYTLQTSLCGPTFNNIHFSYQHFQQIGKRFCQTLLVHFQNHLQMYTRKNSVQPKRQLDQKNLQKSPDKKLEDQVSIETKRKKSLCNRFQVLQELYTNDIYKINNQQASSSDSSPDCDQFSEKTLQKIRKGQSLSFNQRNLKKNQLLLEKLTNSIKNNLKQKTMSYERDKQSQQKFLIHNMIRNKNNRESVNPFRYRSFRKQESLNQQKVIINKHANEKNHKSMVQQNAICTFVEPKVFRIIQPVRGFSKLSLDIYPDENLKTSQNKNYLLQNKKNSIKFLNNSNLYSKRQEIKKSERNQPIKDKLPQKESKDNYQLEQSLMINRRIKTQSSRKKVITIDYESRKKQNRQISRIFLPKS